MGRYTDIGITGANGTVGRVLMAGVQHDYALRAVTRREVDFASTIASFDSVEGLAEAFDGLEAIIHLGADPSPDAPWDSIRDNSEVSDERPDERPGNEMTKRSQCLITIM